MSGRSIGKNLQKKIDNLRIGLVNQVTDDIENGARRNFRAFEKYASTDFPYVMVLSSSLSDSGQTSSREVVCGGNQVLFIEFGVGQNNRYKKTVEHTEDGTVVSWGGKSTFTLTSFFKNFGGSGDIELAPRPAGIDQLGHYHLAKGGQSKGLDDWWIRPTSTGIPNLTAGETHVLKKDGSYREDVVWTTGHSPARALYRAVRSSMTRIEVASLLGGKYRD